MPHPLLKCGDRDVVRDACDREAMAEPFWGSLRPLNFRTQHTVPDNCPAGGPAEFPNASVLFVVTRVFAQEIKEFRRCGNRAETPLMSLLERLKDDAPFGCIDRRR